MPNDGIVVKSRRILTATGWQDGCVVVANERIDAVLPGQSLLLAALERAPSSMQVIDVGNNPVVPGLVDTHVHFRDPGFPEKEDFETGSRAAAAGGVTTVLDMPNVNPPTNTAGIFNAHIANAGRKSIVDFGHNASGVNPETIADLADAGATAFKVFMVTDIGREYPHMPGTAVDDHGTLFRICEEVAKTGRPLFVHPHDQQVYSLMVRRAQDRWGLGPESYARALRDRDSIVIDSGIATLMQLQRVTGVRLHVLHVSSIEGWELIRRAKALGREVTAEVNPADLLFGHPWENVSRNGPYALGSWTPDDDAAMTWEAVTDGGIADVLASDHAPHTKAEKEVGWTNMYAAAGGTPSVQESLPLMLNEVNQGRLSLERLITLFSTNPARLAGLYPRKGVIAPGSDADLVVLDLEKTGVLSAATGYSKCGWSAVEGKEVQGIPVMTMSRGRIVMRDGRVSAEAGSGRFQLPMTIKA